MPLIEESLSRVESEEPSKISYADLSADEKYTPFLDENPTTFFDEKSTTISDDKPTTFSDLFREEYPDSKPPTIVMQIQPTFRSILSPQLSDNDLALYGKNISIHKAVLEREVLDYNNKKKSIASSAKFRTQSPVHYEVNEIVKLKTAFKRRDVEDMPKFSMKVRYTSFR